MEVATWSPKDPNLPQKAVNKFHYSIITIN